MSYVEAIVIKFNGVRPMAAATGYKPSTVMSWKVRGSIPDCHKPKVLKAGISAGIKLQMEDFWPERVTNPNAEAS